ncbi:phasin family protein [Eubacteriaceae bacterium ES3]|nr:phasin family protein [Eubacteriaceae bacterium ES3]
MLTSIGEDLKKIFLAGVGAVAATAEKSQELIDELVEKGELTVEQGKVLNEELKHNIKETIKKNVTVKVEKDGEPLSAQDIMDDIENMSPEDLEAIKEKIETVKMKAEEENTDE